LESGKQVSSEREIFVSKRVKVTMDIEEIAKHMTDKMVIGVEVEYDQNTMVITLDDGSTIELIVDSIYAEVPEYDS
jgi:hypothetical protein